MSHVAQSENLRINASTSIPMQELRFTAETSPGPGGQHANRSKTRIILHFNVQESFSLSQSQKDRIQAKLASRLDSTGTLHISSSSERSQHANKQAALKRFAELLRQALIRPKKRRKTKATLASKMRRLDSKKRRGEVKKQRRIPSGE